MATFTYTYLLSGLVTCKEEGKGKRQVPGTYRTVTYYLKW